MEKFENIMENQGFERYCDQFIRHEYCWISPTFLESAGIRYSIICQNQGDVVITMPRAYHWGINTGPNIAEAVNWAPKSYEPPGNCIECHKTCGSNSSKFMKADGLRQSTSESNRIDKQQPSKPKSSEKSGGGKSKSSAAQ